MLGAVSDTCTPMDRRAVAVLIAAFATAPRVAQADLTGFVMPSLALEHQVGVSIDYLGATDVQGVSVMGDYRRPVSAHVAVTAQAGVQGGARGDAGGWSLANVTLGGLYVSGPSGVRVAATVPLASDEGDAAIPPDVHGTLRVPDGERFAAGTGALLVAASRRIDRPKTFAQVELGVLALVRADRPDELQLHLGLAGGVRVVDRVALIGELTTVSGILSGGLDRLDPDDPAENFRHALDLGLQVELPHVTLSVRLEVPLDHTLRSRDAYVAGLTALTPL